MPNVIEELNKLIQRLEMLFQVQTHEVVQDLKRIRDIIETPVVDEPIEEKDIKELRKEYKEKFQKNPFGWWSKEVLIEKLK